MNPLKIIETLIGGPIVPSGSSRVLVEHQADDGYLEFLVQVFAGNQANCGYYFGYRVTPLLIDGLTPFLESPLQIILFSGKVDFIVVLGACTNDLLAYKLDCKDNWFSANPNSSYYIAIADFCLASGWLSVINQVPRLISAVVRNPGHSLINDALPSLYLFSRYPNLRPFICPFDYYGLSRFSKPVVDPSFIIDGQFNGRNFRVYMQSIRSFACTASLIKQGVKHLLMDSRDHTIKHEMQISEDLQIACNPAPVDSVSIMLSLRSDRKRKLLANPFSDISWSLNMISSYLSRVSGSPIRIHVYLDTYSLPCSQSSFPVPETYLRREENFARLMANHLSSTLPSSFKVKNLSGMSFLEKMSLVRKEGMCFMGYCGAAYCIYSFWSGYNAPSFLIAHDQMFDIYLNPANSYTLLAGIEPWGEWNALFTTMGCIQESYYESYPFEFFTLDRDCATIPLRNFSYSLLKWNLDQKVRRSENP